VQKYTADQLYGGDLTAPQQEVTDILRPYFHEKGVALASVLLWKPDFNAEYEDKIKARAHAAIDADIAKQATVKAQEEGKAEFARTAASANAVAEKQRIEGQGNAARAQIDAENARTIAQVNAETLQITTEAEAARIERLAAANGANRKAEVDAVGGPENYARIEQARAMAGWPISMIVGEGTNFMPVMQVPIPPPPKP
jgi:hypothetical protein